MAVKNIVFDMGGVLLTKADKKDVYNALTFKDDTEVVFNQLFHAPIRTELDRGVVSEEEAFKVIYSAIPERSRKEAKEYFDYYMYHRQTSLGMIELLKELKYNGYNLYVLSNFFKDMKTYIEDNGYNFLDDFVAIFNSSEHKLVKPDKEVYQKFLALYDLKAEECFFTDDKEKNVIGAIECGFKGATFTDCDSLKAALKKDGVNI